MQRRIIASLMMLWIAHPLGAAQDNDKHPVYVGVRACTQCHQGRGMGHQCSQWLRSKHARAYSVLADPAAKKMAELSGIPQEPQESTYCLGCHATGAHVEAWEREEDFQIEDGVQCEKCHGPGSEYMDEATMIDHEKAVAAGLRIPDKRDCLVCHQVKGSHVAIHALPKLEIEKGRQAIAHPAPRNWSYDPRPEAPDIAPGTSAPKYVGVYACAECHRGPGFGYQFSHWRMSAHARAFAVLATPKAYEIAEQKGIKTSPQRSPACLKCHSTAHADPAGGHLPSYWIYEGVGCEACHGPGSEYAPEAVMQDPLAAQKAGLRPVTKETCLKCHADSHDKPFDYEAAYKRIAHASVPPQVVEAPQYKTPLNMALSPNGRELYVACEASDSVIVIDVRAQEKVAEISTGGQPTDVTFHPNGALAYVSNRLDDTVSVVDVKARSVIATLPVGDEPHGVLTDGAGKTLYVLNTLSDDISVFDTQSLKEIKRLRASRSPWSLSLSPNGKQIAITNNLSRFVKFRSPALSEITVIDTDRAIVENRAVVSAANLLQGIAWHPTGDFALFTLNRTKNLVPMTRLTQGWTITNGLGILWRDGQVDQVLLDEPGQCFPDPADVAISPDGTLALVTSSGSNRVAVVDIPKLMTLFKEASAYEREHVLPNHLGKPTEFVQAHIPVSHSPRGVLIAPDSRSAFIANALDDSLSVIDLKTLQTVKRIDLGGSQVLTQTRFGERLFHSADITFHRQFSCHSCHPDGHIDGLTYDIEPDGIGVSPVDNRTLRGILDTAPFKWEGTNPSLQRQCGARLAVFFTRIDPFTPEELSAVDTYICQIQRPPNRHRPLGAELTEAQRRGKAMFERTRANNGRNIARENRCSTCHSPPLFTDRARHDVGTMGPYDREVVFDTPHLFNIYDSAPYLHNGIAPSLEEIWTKYNPHDKHGITNDMTKDQLNDLIEYLKTL
jgi:YVTN family beta-propeller protein